MFIPGDLLPYEVLPTSEYRNQPNFMAVLAALIQGQADNIALLQNMYASFDLDVAVGVQEDVLGQWIGVSRYIEVPLTGVYFSFDTLGLGFDQGTWWNPDEPLDALTTLPDDAYRTLLKARVVANQWNGSIPNAYEAWDTLFAGTGTSILIQDNDNMSMTYALTGPIPDALTLALFEGGYLNLKPAGVRIDDFVTPSVPDTPYFGFDVENLSIAGFDVGAWGTLSPGF